MKALPGVPGVLAATMGRWAGVADFPAMTQVLEETGISAELAVVVGTTDGGIEASLARGGSSKLLRAVAEEPERFLRKATAKGFWDEQ